MKDEIQRQIMSALKSLNEQYKGEYTFTLKDDRINITNIATESHIKDNKQEYNALSNKFYIAISELHQVATHEKTPKEITLLCKRMRSFLEAEMGEVTDKVYFYNENYIFNDKSLSKKVELITSFCKAITINIKELLIVSRLDISDHEKEILKDLISLHSMYLTDEEKEDLFINLRKTKGNNGN